MIEIYKAKEDERKGESGKNSRWESGDDTHAIKADQGNFLQLALCTAALFLTRRVRGEGFYT